MTLSLVPVRGQKGSYSGQLDVTDTRLQDAPAIGSLLDAISVVGIIDQLEGPGIYFQNVEARFRLTPDELILSQSSATGPSMGISMDGYYNLGTKQLDMQGVLSPIYILNGIGSLFTLMMSMTADVIDLDELEPAALRVEAAKRLMDQLPGGDALDPTVVAPIQLT